jgi:hypothetical protein
MDPLSPKEKAAWKSTIEGLRQTLKDFDRKIEQGKFHRTGETEEYEEELQEGNKVVANFQAETLAKRLKLFCKFTKLGLVVFFTGAGKLTLKQKSK